LFLATPLIAQSETSIDTTATVMAAAQTPVSRDIAAIVIDRAPLAPATWISALSATTSVRTPQAVLVAQDGSAGQSTAMMVVGGAGLLVGAIVGGKAGSIIMVGGGLVGLLGLWNYLK
jgi:hypothetical protein